MAVVLVGLGWLAGQGRPTDELFGLAAIGEGVRREGPDFEESRLSFLGVSDPGHGARRVLGCVMNAARRAGPWGWPVLFGVLGGLVVGLATLGAVGHARPGTGRWPVMLRLAAALTGWCLLGPRLLAWGPHQVTEVLAVGMAVLLVLPDDGARWRWSTALALCVLWPLVAPRPETGLILLMWTALGDASQGRDRHGLVVFLVALAVVTTVGLLLGADPGTAVRELVRAHGWDARDAARTDLEPLVATGPGRLLVLVLFAASLRWALVPEGRRGRFLVWLFAVWMALKSQRHAALLVTLSLGPALELVAGAVLLAGRVVPARWDLRHGQILLVWLVLIGAGRWPRTAPRPADPPGGLEPPYRWLQAHGSPGRLFVPVAWSGLTQFRLGTRYPVLLDHRERSFPDPARVDHARILGLQDEEDILDRHRIDTILIPAGSALACALDRKATWIRVHADPGSEVWVRRTSQNLPPASVPPARAPPVPIEELFARALDAVNRGNALRAIHWAGQAVARAPGSPAPRLLEARVLLAFGRVGPASALLEELRAADLPPPVRAEVEKLLDACGRGADVGGSR